MLDSTNSIRDMFMNYYIQITDTFLHEMKVALSLIIVMQASSMTLSFI